MERHLHRMFYLDARFMLAEFFATEACVIMDILVYVYGQARLGQLAVDIILAVLLTLAYKL